VDPAERGELEVVHAAPGALVVGALGLVEPDQALGLGIVVGIADGPDAGERTGVQQPFAVADGGVLPASLWCTTPLVSSPARARVHSAISRASSGSSVGIEAAVRHPTIRRL